MTINDALSIFNITGEYTPDSIKLLYRQASSKYHPDRNPAGLEMMKLINQAYDTLKSESGNAKPKDNDNDLASYGDVIFKALSAIIHLNFDIEICGSWVWLHGDTKPHRELLKANGFRWAPKKCLWYFRPDDYKSNGRGKFSMDDIRSAHGSERITNKERTKLKAA